MFGLFNSLKYTLKNSESFLLQYCKPLMKPLKIVSYEDNF